MQKISTKSVVLPVLLIPSILVAVLLSSISFESCAGASASPSIEVVISPPHWVPLESPFQVYVSLETEYEVRMKASLVTAQGKQAAKFWNGTKWVYPGGSWNSMPIISGNFSGFLALLPDPDYSGWDVLNEGDAGFMKISIRPLDSTKVKSFSEKIMTIGSQGNLTRGFRILGELYPDEHTELGAFVVLKLSDVDHKRNRTDELEGMSSYCSIPPPWDPDTMVKSHHFDLWALEGNYSLQVFSGDSMDHLLHQEALHVSSNMSVIIGTPPPLPEIIDHSDHLMITEVHYHEYAHGGDEYVVLTNENGSSLELEGWVIRNKDGEMDLPQIVLEPGEHLTLARDPIAYGSLTGRKAHHTLRISLDNEADSLTLCDQGGNVVDAVAWGMEGVPGTEGGLDPVNKGGIIRRKVLNDTFIDTNTIADWESERIRIAGQSDFPLRTFEFNGELTAFVSPDSSYSSIVREFEAASESIHINMYEFTNLHLMYPLLEALNRSVEVTMLLEGGPVGGISKAELYVVDTLFDAGADVYFLHRNASVNDRYDYDHAKYVVIDQSTLILESENWKSTGIPAEPSYGNRGWGIIVRNAEVSAYFAEVLREDSNPNLRDIVPYRERGQGAYTSPVNFTPIARSYSGTYEPAFSSMTITEECSIMPVLGPDHTLSGGAILGLLNNASRTLYIQQLQCPMNWGSQGPNQYLEAAIEAAKRGCDVRIFLDSRYVDTTDGYSDNYDTVEYVNRIASENGLDNLEARLAVLKGISKIHNKGVIVDGTFTLISSINWGRGAVFLNREAGVIVENERVAEYFSGVFLYDWDVKETHEGSGYDTNGPFERDPLQWMSSMIAIGLGALIGFLMRRNH